jgi:REP element-mobilizing transposase RayT
MERDNSHFITTSCYRRLPLLGNARNRDLFLRVLESVRRRYRFVVASYVVMPEHVHLLISEPQRDDPSVVGLSGDGTSAAKAALQLHPNWHG